MNTKGGRVQTLALASQKAWVASKGADRGLVPGGLGLQPSRKERWVRARQVERAGVRGAIDFGLSRATPANHASSSPTKAEGALRNRLPAPQGDTSFPG